MWLFTSKGVFSRNFYSSARIYNRTSYEGQLSYDFNDTVSQMFCTSFGSVIFYTDWIKHYCCFQICFVIFFMIVTVGTNFDTKYQSGKLLVRCCTTSSSQKIQFCRKIFNFFCKKTMKKCFSLGKSLLCTSFSSKWFGSHNFLSFLFCSEITLY